MEFFQSNVVLLQHLHSGKYVRTQNDGKVDAKGLSGDARSQWVVHLTDSGGGDGDADDDVVFSLQSKAFPRRYLAITSHHGLKTSIKGDGVSGSSAGIMSGESPRDCYFNRVHKVANIFSLVQATKHGIASFSKSGEPNGALASRTLNDDAVFQVVVLEGLFASGNLLTIQSELTGKFLQAFDYKDPAPSGLGTKPGRIDCNGKDADGKSGWIVHSGGTVADLARGGGSAKGTIRLQNFDNPDYWLKISDQGGLGCGDGNGKDYEHAVTIIQGDTVNFLADNGGKFAAVNKQGLARSGKNLSRGDPAANFKITLVQSSKEGYPSIKGHGDSDEVNEPIRF